MVTEPFDPPPSFDVAPTPVPPVDKDAKKAAAPPPDENLNVVA